MLEVNDALNKGWKQIVTVMEPSREDRCVLSFASKINKIRENKRGNRISI